MDKKNLLFIFVLLPSCLATTFAGLGATCDPNACEGEEDWCDDQLFLVCQNATFEGEEAKCVCREHYHPDMTQNNGTCLAQVSFPCNEDVQCFNDLARCEGNPPTCRCIPGYLQVDAKCLAPIGGACLESDGCIDDNAVCAEISSSEPTSFSVPELSRAPLSFTGHTYNNNQRTIGSRPLAYIAYFYPQNVQETGSAQTTNVPQFHNSDNPPLNSRLIVTHVSHLKPNHNFNNYEMSTKTSSENHTCVCDDGYEAVDMRCKLSGASTISSPLILSIICFIFILFKH